MISFVCPIKNRVDLFEVTINSILDYALDVKDKFEIIVLDSGSTDSIKSFIKETRKKIDISYAEYAYPNIIPRHNPAYAHNLGVQLAKYDSVVLTSPEIAHKTEVIKQLIPLVGKNLTCSIIDLNENGSFWRVLVSDKFRGDDPGLYFIGMYNKKDFLSIGGIDEKFMEGESFEDTDFGKRWKLAKLPFEFHNEIIGRHLWHPRVSRDDFTYKVNESHDTWNRRNKVIKVNEEIMPGDPQYITERI